MYISGSDIPIIMGVGHITPYELWLVKKGEAQIEETDEMKMGKLLENVIRHRYQSICNFQRDEWLSYLFHSQKNKKAYVEEYHGIFYQFINSSRGLKVDNKLKYPYFRGHLDDFHTKKRIVAEFKATRDYIVSCPVKYQLQTAFYCILTEAKEGHIAVLHNTLDISTYVYQRTNQLESLIIHKATEFYEKHLKADIPPTARTLDDVREKSKDAYHHLRDEAFVADSTTINKIQLYKEMSKELKEKQNQVDTLKVELLNQFKDNELIIDEHGNELATYKFNKTITPNIDKKMLQSQYPEIWEKVKIERVPARSFRVK